MAEATISLTVFREVGSELIESTAFWVFPPRVGDTVRLELDEPIWTVSAVVHVIPVGDVAVYLRPAREWARLQA